MPEARNGCAVGGCGKPRRSAQHCGMHHTRLRRTGSTDPGPSAQMPLQDRYWRKVVQNSSGCWDWSGAIGDTGYTRIDSNHYGHRVSYEIHHGPIPPGMYVLHRCDNRRCTNPDHLFIGTHDDNMRDMQSKGRGRWSGVYGERHGGAKLTEAQVIEMRRLHAAGGISQAALARRFGVSQAMVSRIIRRTAWRSATSGASS